MSENNLVLNIIIPLSVYRTHNYGVRLDICQTEIFLILFHFILKIKNRGNILLYWDRSRFYVPMKHNHILLGFFGIPIKLDAP